MNASAQFCPNSACSASGLTKQGNITIHDRKRQRFRCKICRHTFTARTGTMLEGLRKPAELIFIVVGLLSYGCPLQAIVQVFGLDERTMASWRDRAGQQCQRVQQAIVQQGQLTECCLTTTVHITPYSQVIFETNRYSVPAERARREVIVKAYPFHLDILDQTTLLARHPRCYEREQDVFNPQHYLSLLAQRPGAFDYAKPLKRWREQWPESYERMLHRLREQWPEGRGVREFIHILQLHQQYPPALMEAAIAQALDYGCVHLDGVQQCVQQLTMPQAVPSALDLTDHPHLQRIGTQPIDLQRYEQLLATCW